MKKIFLMGTLAFIFSFVANCLIDLVFDEPTHWIQNAAIAFIVGVGMMFISYCDRPEEGE